MLQRQRQVTGTQLGAHLTIYDDTTRSVFDQIRAGLMAAGTDAVTATERAYAVMRGMLLREASMVSFVMLFRILGIVFLALIPLVALMSRPRAGGPAPPAH